MSSVSINPELLRQYYLQQLGIVCYRPRVAEQITQVATQEAVEPSATVLSVEQVEAPASAAVPASLTNAAQYQAVSPAAALRVVIEPQIPVAELRRPPVSAAEELRTTAGNESHENQSPAFQALFILAGKLALLLQVPAQGAARLSAAEQKLLANIVLWLGQSLPVPLEFRNYRWPLPGLPLSSHGAASNGLNTFMQQAVSEQATAAVLVFGELPISSFAEVNTATPVVQLASLAVLLNVPQLKREAWLALLPVQGLLQSQQH